MGTEEVAMTYPLAAVERAMKVQDVILDALSRRQLWLQVADVLGVSALTPGKPLVDSFVEVASGR